MSFVNLIKQIDDLVERPDWDTYFMVMAHWTAKRSSCNRLHVGCVIVKDRHIVSTGYNGHLPGAPHVSVVVNDGEQMTVHAEQNAVADAAGRGVAIAGSTAYVTHMPCINCAKVLAAAKVSKIIYHHEHKPNQLTLDILKSGNIEVVKFADFPKSGLKLGWMCKTCGNDLDSKDAVCKCTKDEKKNTVVALTGAMYSGKSTVAEHLCKRGYTELSFAEPLKEMIISLFGIDRKYLYDPKLKQVVIPEWGVSGRELAQVIGTELFRDALPKHLPKLKLVDGGFWITLLSNKLNAQNKSCVISDCRFPDERKFVKSRGGTVVKITRKNLETTGVTGHASEQGIEGDITVTNDGTKEQLFESFKNF